MTKLLGNCHHLWSIDSSWHSRLQPLILYPWLPRSLLQPICHQFPPPWPRFLASLPPEMAASAGTRLLCTQPLFVGWRCSLPVGKCCTSLESASTDSSQLEKNLQSLIKVNNSCSNDSALKKRGVTRVIPPPLAHTWVSPGQSTSGRHLFSPTWMRLHKKTLAPSCTESAGGRSW